MKRFIAGIFILCIVIPVVFSQPITIDEKDLEDIIRTQVTGALTEAVDKAVAEVVKEYEIKLIDKNIEIVIVTAYTDRKREEILLTVGTPEKLLYLKKPFDREEILQVMLSLTLKWSLEKEVCKQMEVATQQDGLALNYFG